MCNDWTFNPIFSFSQTCYEASITFCPFHDGLQSTARCLIDSGISYFLWYFLTPHNLIKTNPFSYFRSLAPLNTFLLTGFMICLLILSLTDSESILIINIYTYIRYLGVVWYEAHGDQVTRFIMHTINWNIQLRTSKSALTNHNRITFANQLYQNNIWRRKYVWLHYFQVYVQHVNLYKQNSL